MKRLLVLTLLINLAIGGFSQAKKPTIMVVPSDAWCIQNGYFTEWDDFGSIQKIPNYKQAMQENMDVLLVIGAINTMMSDRGFPLKDLESSIRTMESDAAEDAMRTSSDGDGVAESPIDALKKSAKADIWMQLTWSINETGPKKSVTFNLRGLDAYTDKQVAGAQGTGEPSFSAETPVLLQEAVTAHIDNFNAQLMAHFEDMFANGREINVRVQAWNSWDGDLYDEYGDDGDDLITIIEDWMFDNCAGNRAGTPNHGDTQMLFEGARIPMYDEKGRATDARRFARGLGKYLSDTYGIENKVVMKGLGRATVILGGK